MPPEDKLSGGMDHIRKQEAQHMRAVVELWFMRLLLLSALSFVLSTIGVLSEPTGMLAWFLLLGSAVMVGRLIGLAGGISLRGRLSLYGFGWVGAAVAALALWIFAQQWWQSAFPAFKGARKLWDTFEPLALFGAGTMLVVGAAILTIGSLDRTRVKPGSIEHGFIVNLPAKIAAVPMAFTAIGVFVIATLWTVYHSFTNSKLLPSSKFVGIDQYERLWSSDRWYISIENLAIYGLCALVFSLVIGFLLAAMMDQKIRFENTFRTIFLYPYALSFIVTGLVWQWILTPEFGVQNIVRSLGFESFEFNPLFDADLVIYGILIAGLWQGTGLIMVLMLAGLRGIDQEIWKASRVEGIPAWKTYVFIVIPMMRPVFITTLVILASGIIRVYDLVVAQTSGGPGLASEVPAKYVFDYMFGGQNLGQGFAASTMMLFSVLVVLVPWAYLEFGRRERA